MVRKRVKIGQDEWEIRGDEVQIIDAIKAAMQNDAVAQLQLHNRAGAEVTVLINAKAVPTVVIDSGSGPRPSEIQD